MATSQARFKWIDDKLINFIKCLQEFKLYGMIHIWRPLWGGWKGARGRGGVRQKWDVIGRRGWGAVSVLDVHDQTSWWWFLNINMLLVRNLPIDSSVRQWSHPLTIPLHCLWAKLNNRKRGQFECDMTWFCFYFGFVRSHARCGCCSIVC